MLELPSVVFPGGCSPEDQACILESPLLQNWIQDLSPDFSLHHIQVLSATFVPRRSGRKLLFLKLMVKAQDRLGRLYTRTTLLRGDAVGILIVLHCCDEDYTLLVEQPRMPGALLQALEIPAGMVEGHSDPLQVAIHELDEEVGLVVQPVELVDLTASVVGRPLGIHSSPGLLDERIRLYLLERTITEGDLRALDGRAQTYTAEDEHICTKVVKLADAPRLCADLKCHAALLLYWMHRGVLK